MIYQAFQSSMVFMDIPILFEDENYIVLNKPAGLQIHPGKEVGAYTLVDWVKEHFPKLESIGGQFEFGEGGLVSRFGIVHRLDKDTSGAILIAKNKQAFEYLQGQIRVRKVLKVYHVFVHGKMKDERGIIDRPIGRSSGDSPQWSAARGVRGSLRDAITQYRTLVYKDGFSLLEVIPKTGRTHQIRVHFKSLQHIVLGDVFYGSKPESVFGFKRTALHSIRFSFKDMSGKEIRVEAPYPKDFEEAVAKIKTM